MGLISAGLVVLASVLLATEHAPDLTISETVSPAQVSVGDRFSYTTTVRNVPASGPSATATNIAVWLAIPEGVAIESVATSADVACSPQQTWVSCTVPILTPDASVTITVHGTLEAHASGTLFALAGVDPDDTIEERNDLNNSALASAHVLLEAPALAIDSNTKQP